jgi:citrate synthase
MEAIARGLEGVVVTETRLSDVDGERGELLIGGFPVEELAPHASFEEVLYLLWHGRLPNPEERATLCREMAAQRSLPPTALGLMRDAARCNSAPMDALRMGVSALSLADSDAGEMNHGANLRRAVGAVSRFATLIAAHWRGLRGLEPVAPRADLGHVANYLYMLNGEEASPALVRALETYFNTVVDHGMNASTFTARVVASTESDMISALTGAVGALKGPRHGGAPGPALDTVFEIRERVAKGGGSLAEEAEARVREIISGGGRLMGFGHRVYKVRDPRAEVLGAAAVRLFEHGGDLRLYQDALGRRRDPARPARARRGAGWNNVEFYTALLSTVSASTALFTPSFAAARAGGWSAHILEQYEENRLIRPASVYVGKHRHWPERLAG